MSVLTIERQPPVRLLRLDTGVRNLLTLEAVHALEAALAPDAEAPVVLLSGRADGFCGGLDAAALADGGREQAELLAAMSRLVRVALAGPTRIVAACEAHAIGFGATLLLAADVRIGARGTYQVGFTEPRRGVPLPELTALLARERLARRRLHELTVLGGSVNPTQAAAAGFFDTLVAGTALHETALARAHELASLDEGAYLGSLAAVWGPTLARIDALVDAAAGRVGAAPAG